MPRLTFTVERQRQSPESSQRKTAGSLGRSSFKTSQFCGMWNPEEAGIQKNYCKCYKELWSNETISR